MTDERLIDFASLLRQNGVRVSPGEVADAARSLLLVPMDDRSAVRAALRSSLVKRASEVVTFDRLFDLYFGALGRLLEGLEESLANALAIDELTLEELQEIGRALAAMTSGTPLSQAIAEGSLGEVAKLLRTAALQVDFSQLKSPLQRGFYARRLGVAADLPGVARDLDAFSRRLREQGVDPRLIERISRRLDGALSALEETARRAADLEYEARDREKLARLGEAPIHRAIQTLSPEELSRMREVVRRLAQKLKSRIARRRRNEKRGQLHVRRTLRQNLGLGGVPMELAFRRKRKERPEVVVLCDVSDSVRNVSRLMLQFVYTLQSLYARVRSFVFVSDLGEVTRLFKDASVEEAVEGAVAARAINLSANSNYGHALGLFHRDFAGAVTRRTTVLVIGDGRSNYNPVNAWVLGELKRKCRRLLWICPEDESAWGFGDSEMPLFARHCHEVFVVRTVDELARAAERLMP